MDTKLAAAEAAAALVSDGMTVGLGSGSTAALAVRAIGRRAPRIVGVPTSETTAARARELGAVPVLREGFVTDGGNCILDCTWPEMGDAAALADRIDSVVGVVEHGLFIGLAAEAFIGGPAGVRVLAPEA